MGHDLSGIAGNCGELPDPHKVGAIDKVILCDGRLLAQSQLGNPVVFVGEVQLAAFRVAGDPAAPANAAVPAKNHRIQMNSSNHAADSGAFAHH